MRAIIIGAGDVGKQMARVLCFRKNDVVVIDYDGAILEDMKNQLDIMTVAGNGATGRFLLKAGIEDTDLLLAVSNNSEANILACLIANHYQVPKKIARIRSNEYFDLSHKLTTATFGIDHVIIPEYECATDILDVLLRPAIKETVKFSHPDAQMANFQIKPGSPMIGTTLNSFSRPEFLEHLRICAVLRYGKLLIPTGAFSFMAFDEVYVAGPQTVIDELVSWSESKSRLIKKVIIAGGTRLGGILASMLVTADMHVCLIEPDRREAERVADVLGTSAIIIQGQSTDISVLEEAGIEHCDAFISANLDDEVNILSCMLANTHGAGKVIAVTSNLEYVKIISGMTIIDCCFSPLISAINILINHIKTENRQTVAVLKRTTAEILEFTVHNDSPVAGRLIRNIDLPAQMVFALIIRDGNLVPALGSAMIQENDHVFVFTKSESAGDVERLFSAKRFFS